MAESCAVIILAAGASERLGEPKQLLPFRGSSLLSHAVSEAGNSDARLVVVVVGEKAERVSKEIDQNIARVVNNNEWHEGMASSVRVGIKAVLEISPSVDAIILMPCDQPYVSASLLNELMELQTKTGKAIVASDYGNAIGPPALFHKNIFPELMLLQGDTGARKIVEKHGDEVATVLFTRGNIDIDTKEDYEALKILSSQ